VKRTCVVSCSGTHERAWICCDWLNMKGCCLPAVIDGSSHCRPDAVGAVLYVMRTCAGRVGVSMVSFVPSSGSASPASANCSGAQAPAASLPSTFSMVRSRVSSTSCVAAGSIHSSVSVAVPARVLLAKSSARSSARSLVHTLPGSAYECSSLTVIGVAGLHVVGGGAGAGAAVGVAAGAAGGGGAW
jgi:hypothetical protein